MCGAELMCKPRAAPFDFPAPYHELGQECRKDFSLFCGELGREESGREDDCGVRGERRNDYGVRGGV